MNGNGNRQMCAMDAGKAALLEIIATEVHGARHQDPHAFDSYPSPTYLRALLDLLVANWEPTDTPQQLEDAMLGAALSMQTPEAVQKIKAEIRQAIDTAPRWASEADAEWAGEGS